MASPTGGKDGRARDKRGTFVTAPETIERDAEAFRMKSRGATYAEIAIALGFTDATHACKAMKRHLDRTISPSIEEYRAIQAEQLEHLYREGMRVMETAHLRVSGGKVVYLADRVTGQEKELHDDTPVLRAIETLIRVMDRKAKLLGLDAPQKVIAEVSNVTVTVKGADDV